MKGMCLRTKTASLLAVGPPFTAWGKSREGLGGVGGAWGREGVERIWDSPRRRPPGLDR